MQAGQPYQPRARRWLAVLLLASCALSLWYGWATPLGEGPDEPAHLEYILYLAREARLPTAQAQLDHPGEAHQPPLAYLLAQPLVSWLPEDQAYIELGQNPRWTWSGGTEAAAYFRRTAELVAPSGTILAWRLVRALSALIGALTVALTYMLAGRLGCQPGVALGAAALLAFLPQFAFHHGLVSNDPLLWALSTATLVWLVPAPGMPAAQPAIAAQPAEPPSRNAAGAWSVGLGLLLGAALLTKASAIILVPLAACGIWLRWRAGLLRHPWRAALLTTLLMLALSGWWFWGNLQRTGDPWGIEEFRATFATTPFDPGNAEHWRSAGRVLASSLVARFGWANLPAPALVYWLTASIALTGAAGMLLRCVTGSRPSGWVWLMMLMTLLTAGWIFVFALTAGQVAGQGRFLFPALPVMTTAIAWGLAQLKPRPALLGAAAAALLATAAALPEVTIRPAYAWYVTGPQPAAASLGRFAGSGEPGIQLRGASFPRSVEAGERFPVGLTWHAIGRPDRSWTVFIHLSRAQEDHPLIAVDEPPLAGQFPMLAWTSGDWIRDQHFVVVPPDLEPGTYVLRVGLFDPHTDGRRAGVYAGDALIGDYVELGSIQVTSGP